MNERLPAGRFLLLSVAAHAAAFGVLAFVFVTASGTEPLARVEGWGTAVTALEEPSPDLEPTVDAPLPRVEEPAGGPEVVEAVPAREGDPRFATEEAGDAGAAPGPDAPGLIGIGGGGPRIRARRIACAAPAPEAPAALPVEAPPSLPDVRARPVPGRCPAPAYPARERRLGVEGVVEVLVAVAADGSVDSAEVAASSGAGALDEAAVAAVLGWRFEPAVAAGAPVPDRVLQKVRFRLVSAAMSGR